MKKLAVFVFCLVFLGIGCSSPAGPTVEESVYGTSHFGVLTGSGIDSSIEGGWVRPHPGPFWWDEIERKPGEYDWTRSDHEVKKWNKANQAILATVWPFSQWDQARCRKDDPKVANPFGLGEVWLGPVCNVDSFNRFMTALVERYDGDGVDDMPALERPITHWEISSEPDMQSNEISFYQGGPAGYAELLQLSYVAIKAADPGAVVVVAGQSGATYDGINFFRTVLQMSRGKFDVLNIHSIAVNDQFWAKEYRSFTRGLGFEQDFWITEALVGDVEHLWDEDEAAQMTFTGYVNAFANGAEKIFNVGAHDPTGGPGKQSEAVFQLMAQTIGFFDSVDRLSENSVLFNVDDKSIIAMWDGAGLPGDIKGSVETLRYDGTREFVEAVNFNAHVPTFVFVD